MRKNWEQKLRTQHALTRTTWKIYQIFPTEMSGGSDSHSATIINIIQSDFYIQLHKHTKATFNLLKIKAKSDKNYSCL